MIVVFGSINLDLVARVARLPRPGETAAGRSFSSHPGGKGANQALAARRAGADVALFGCVGRDAFAMPALALVRQGGVQTEGVREAEGATGVALIHVEDSGENAITVVAGANACASAQQVPDAVLGAATIVVLQFETPADQGLALAMRARSRGARVVLNPAPFRVPDPAWLSAIDVLVANEHEAAGLACAFSLPEEPGAFASALAQRKHVTTVVTLGGRGALASTPADRFEAPALAVNSIDSVGAGDAFVGVLAAALDRGLPFSSALVRATAAGGLACTREGAQDSLPLGSEIDRAAATLQTRLRITTLT